MSRHTPTDDSLGGRPQARLLAACRRLWGKIAGGTVLASYGLYAGETHPEYLGYGTLGAEPPLPSTQELVT